MPDEKELVGGSEPEEEDEDLEPEEEEEEEESSAPKLDPTTALEQRIAALEQAHRQSVQDLRSAVGRVQSLAARLDKTNDPQVEAKLRQELAGVSDLLGLVTDSIDESILPRDVKQRVAGAQVAARAAVADAEINRRIAEAVAPILRENTVRSTPQEIDADAIEASAVAQIRALGLDDTDPAFNWTTAAALLHSQGPAAMWSYFAGVERQLLSAKDAGPQRRPRTNSPRNTGPANNPDVTTQMEKAMDSGDLAEGLKLLKSLGVNV